MPLLPKGQGYSATIGDAPIFAGRRATSQDFGAPGLGDSGMVGAGHQVQAAAQTQLNDLEEKEARTALVQSTEIRAQYARKLDQAALDGSDLGKLKEEMANDLAKVGEQFATKKGEEQLRLYTANSEIMYDQQANQINVQRAWSEARLQGQKFVNNASALIQSNPAYLAVAEQNAKDFVATFPNIRPDQKAELTDRLTKDLNMASAISATRINPEDARKRLEAGEWDLTPEQRNTAIDKAHAETRAARAEEAYVRAEKEREKHEVDGQARDQHFKTIYDGGYSRRAVMDDPRLLPATREHLVRFAEARAKEFAGQERKSDEATKRNLWMAINAPEGDPRKIYNADPVFKAVEVGLLNTTDANQLNSMVAGQKDENGRAFQSRLRERMIILGRALNESPEYKNQPELSSAIQNKLIGDAERKAAELRKANKSPDSLLDETSNDYLFKPGALKDAAAGVKRETAAQVLAGATRVNSVAEMLAQPDGAMLVDSKGKLTPMTPALRAKLTKDAPPGQAPVFPVVPSGETPEKQQQRERRKNSEAYNRAMGFTE